MKMNIKKFIGFKKVIKMTATLQNHNKDPVKNVNDNKVYEIVAEHPEYLLLSEINK
jgi:hypothetical protein